MKADFSRSTFDPRKHYRGVRMQQGRVQLDADWNESLDVLLHRIETETIDVIGECGVPEHQAAFGAVIKAEDLPPEDQEYAKKELFPLKPGDFLLTKGRAYVDGILVEMEKVVPFSQQPYATPKMEENGVFALYLDVWERLVTALEDPSIRETALGGPDTAVRSQVIWQAALTQVGEKAEENISCANVKNPFPAPSNGKLCARTTPSPEPDDPCTVAPGAGYKRLENQLYRVEIHNAETGKETFKWSRENGSILVKIAALNVDGSSAKIQVASLGRDEVLGLHELDFVEVIDEAHELAGNPGLMAKILKIDPDDNVLTLDKNVSGFELATAKLRRWESGELAVASAAAAFFAPEGGIEIKFEYEAGKTVFHSGDYWQIPARTVPGKFGTIEWPNEGDPSKPICMLPFGIQHHYCKLAIITVEGGEVVDIEDCRKKFPPLTELPGGKCCCSVTVGPHGDYADLQSAIDARPNDAKTWHVCLEPGAHFLQETVEVSEVRGLAITGCELQTRLVAPDGKPAIVFAGGKQLRLEGFGLFANSPKGALIFKGSEQVRIVHLTAENATWSNLDNRKAMFLHHDAAGTDSEPGPIIVAIHCRDFEISENNFVGNPAIKAQARLLNIHKNRLQGGGIQILPGSAYVEISDNFVVEGSGPGIQFGGLSKDESRIIFDKQSPEYYQMAPVVEKKVVSASEAGASDVSASDATYAAVENNAVSADNVEVHYINMNMNIERKVTFHGFYGSALSTTGVRITGNTILGMEGSGIITKNDINSLHDLGDLEDVVISDNRISQCGSKADLNVFEKMQVGGGIVLTGVFNAEITNNIITENGAGEAACGVYLLDGGNIEIANNSILENGAKTTDPETTLYQAGIGGHFLLGNLLGDFVEGLDDAKPGYPALRVHGNEVVCPAGPALSVIAVGSVVAEDNTFATREIRRQPKLLIGGKEVDLFTILERGSCVTIIDLGISITNPGLLGILGAFMEMAAGNLNIQLNDQTAESIKELFPDGRVLFSGNQVNFHTAEETPLSPVGELAGLAGALSNGQVQLAKLLLACTLSTFIFTLDDTAIQDNQFRADVPQALLMVSEGNKRLAETVGRLAYLSRFIHVASFALTARATGNAIAENNYPLSTALSYGSYARFMNTATNNQVTHVLLTRCNNLYNNLMVANRSLTILLP